MEQQCPEELDKAEKTVQACSTLNKDNISLIVSEVVKTFHNENPNNNTSGDPSSTFESGDPLPGMLIMCCMLDCVYLIQWSSVSQLVNR